MKDLHSNTDPWKELLKDKVNQYAADSQPDWTAFSQRLNKPAPRISSSFLSRKVFYGVGIVATVLSISYFTFFYEAKSDENAITLTNDSAATTPEYISNPSSSQLKSEIETTGQLKSESLQGKENELVAKDSPVIDQDQHPILMKESHSQVKEIVALKPHDLNQAVQTNKTTNNLPFVPDARFSWTMNQPCSPMLVHCTPNELSDSVFYLWTSSEGQVSTDAKCTFTFTQSGEHWITLTVNYFRSTEKASYTQQEGLQVFPQPNSDFIVENQRHQYEFRPRVSSYSSYDWEIADLQFANTQDLEYSFVKSGTYPVILKIRSAEGCYSETRKDIKVEVLHPVFVGNAFTPDGDGVNDYFGPKSEAIGEYDYQMEIYNRYGSIIFRTNSADVLWDGSIFGSEPASEGFYHYKITTRDQSGNSQSKTGEVYLIRKK